LSEQGSSAGGRGVTPQGIRRDGDRGTADGPAPRRLAELESAEALRMLGSVQFGRVVFTLDALPAIRTVNHILAHGLVLFRTDTPGTLSAICGADAGGSVVAYQADSIDADTRLGWSVSVVGRAAPVTEPEMRERYLRLCAPWFEPATDEVLCIVPRMVTGFRLV
jgi:hypothetical protein